MKLTITIPKLQTVDFAFILYFTYSIWVAVLKLFLPDNFVNYFASIVMILFFAFAIVQAYQQQPIADVLWVYLIVLILFVFTYLINVDLRYTYWDENWGISRIIQFSSGGIWAYLAVRLVPDFKRLLSNFKIVAYITFIYYLIALIRMLPVGMWYIQNNQGIYQYSEYNLGFGYSMIFAAVVLLCCWYAERKLWQLIIAAVAAVCAIIWGSRGPLLCILLAVFLLFVLYQQEAKHRRVITTVLVVLAVVMLVVIFSNTILSALNSLLARFGLSSRTINSLLQGVFTEDASRTTIWSMVLERIRTVFPLGLGAFGDRMIVMPYYAWGYSHDIFLEMTVSFGIFGILFLVWLIYRAIRVLITKPNCRLVLIIMLSMFMKLLVSDSFWFYWAFWGLLAICISTLNLKRVNIRNGRSKISSSFNS